MRRKSERNKGKSPEPAPKAERPKRGRLSRKRKKSSSEEKESESDGGIQENPDVQSLPSKSTNSERRKSGEGNCDDDSEPMWHVMKSESSGNSGEIQKLKICLAKSPSTPERPDRSPRGKKRSSHSSVEALSDVGEDKRKSRHKSRRNSGKDTATVQSTSETEEHTDDHSEREEVMKSLQIDNESLPEKENTLSEVKESQSEGEDPATETVAICEDNKNVTIVEQTVVSEAEPKETIIIANVVENDSTEKVEPAEPANADINKEVEIQQESEELPVDKPEDNPVSDVNNKDEIESIENVPKQNIDEKPKPVEEVPAIAEAKEESCDKKESIEEIHDKCETLENTQSNKEETQVHEETDCVEITNKNESSIAEETVAEVKNETATEVNSVRKRRWGSRSTKSNKTSTVSISTDSLKNLIPKVEPVSVEDVMLEVKPKEEKQVEKLIVEEKVKPNGKYNTNNTREKSKEREILGSLSHRKISVVSEDIPKEQRSPTPSKHKSSSVLYITNLVRPFTLPQLKNLLLRTGKIVENGFWIDKIKSRCYVQYQNEDEAIETRHALHGVTWPVSNPKTLVVDFSSESAMHDAMENSEDDKVIITSETRKEHNAKENDFRRDNETYEKRAVIREWDVGKGDNRESRDDGMGRIPIQGYMRDQPDGDRIDKRKRRSKSTSPARKFKKKEDEAPSKLLDDLFRKTKATPCIYWLPLNAETILVKEEQRRKHMAEHERRMEELRRANEERASRHAYHTSNRHR